MQSTHETWLPIPGHDKYEVSDQGEVRSWKTATPHRRKTPRTLKQVTSRGGYKQVSPCEKGENRTRDVHTLVLLAFVGECPPGQQVRHKNGDKTDNRLDNLVYGTPVENNQDKREHGTYWVNGDSCMRGHVYNTENSTLSLNADGTLKRRNCRVCMRISERKYELKRAARKLARAL